MCKELFFTPWYRIGPWYRLIRKFRYQNLEGKTWYPNISRQYSVRLITSFIYQLPSKGRSGMRPISCNLLRLLHWLTALILQSQHWTVCPHFHIITGYEQLITIPVLHPQSLNINRYFQCLISILGAITGLLGYTIFNSRPHTVNFITGFAALYVAFNTRTCIPPVYTVYHAEVMPVGVLLLMSVTAETNSWAVTHYLVMLYCNFITSTSNL